MLVFLIHPCWYSGVAATSGETVQAVQSELKNILVYYLGDEDSEQYPSEIGVRNISDLKEQLSEVCGIKNKDSRT